MNIHHIDKKNEEAMEHRSQTYRQVVSRDHDLATHQYAQAGSQQKEKESISEIQSSMTFHKRKVLTKEYKPPD
jgi:hypothetical protein